MKINSLRFSNATGLMLSARLDTPVDSAYHTMVLFAHCFTCSKNVNFAAHVSRFLTQKGFAVFLLIELIIFYLTKSMCNMSPM